MLVRSVKKLQQGRFEWQFGHSLGDYKSELAQVEQDIETALYEWKYDCFFALENGIDWKTRLGSHNQKDLLDRDIQEVVKNREDVLGISDFQSTVTGRTYICSLSVYTIYSEQAQYINFTMGA